MRLCVKPDQNKVRLDSGGARPRAPRLFRSPGAVIFRELLHLALIAELQVRFLQWTGRASPAGFGRSEEHTSELQSRLHIVCRPLLENKQSTAAATTHA